MPLLNTYSAEQEYVGQPTTVEGKSGNDREDGHHHHAKDLISFHQSPNSFKLLVYFLVKIF